ncbi:MAG: P-II family nitrogen regulator [Thermoplasmata archaeon]|nr:P-II family nitrogen regulator [Thermoplasmata archaeon]
MKMIIAIVRPERLQCVKDGLSKIGVNGVTISHVTGRGEQMGLVFTTRVGEFVVDEIEKVKLEIVTDDEKVDEVIAKIREKAETGHPGDGRIFVLPVEQSIRIRSEDSAPKE